LTSPDPVDGRGCPRVWRASASSRWTAGFKNPGTLPAAGADSPGGSRQRPPSASPGGSRQRPPSASPGGSRQDPRQPPGPRPSRLSHLQPAKIGLTWSFLAMCRVLGTGVPKNIHTAQIIHVIPAPAPRRNLRPHRAPWRASLPLPPATSPGTSPASPSARRPAREDARRSPASAPECQARTWTRRHPAPPPGQQPAGNRPSPHRIASHRTIR
jgi:hypothetical protein